MLDTIIWTAILIGVVVFSVFAAMLLLYGHGEGDPTCYFPPEKGGGDTSNNGNNSTEK